MKRAACSIFLRWLCFVLLAVRSAFASAFANHAQGGLDDGSPTNAAFTNHLVELKKKVPHGFTIVVQPPLVVIGDEAPNMVRWRATNTVKWTVDKLKQH